MKIQCDVCSKDEASVFCTADEASLCDACDHRVHHANKLASKHHRFSLLYPSSKNFPACDVCQEKRAFLFCQQDRAILCKDCDGPIHKANEHTKKHNRFLLTGVELSVTSALYIPSSSSSSSVTNNICLVPDNSKPQSTNKPVSITTTVSNTKTSLSSNPSPNKVNVLPSQTVINKGVDNNKGFSSISEYLMETLPGWHVEDFLDLPSTPPLGFSKPNDEMLPFVGAEFGGSLSPICSETNGIWVPQAPSPLHPVEHYQEMVSQKETINSKANNRRWSDDGFTVPQISPPSIGSKRSRSFW